MIVTLSQKTINNNYMRELLTTIINLIQLIFPSEENKMWIFIVSGKCDETLSRNAIHGTA